MAEYIERSVAKEELLSWARCIKHPEHLMTEDAMYILDGIPAADVVEVKHGRWEDIGNDLFDLWKCSVCGTEWNFAYDPTSTDTKVNYCPDCGARMDGSNADSND